LSDGTGREPAVAEMSRPVSARTAISIPLIGRLLRAVRTRLLVN
jgi:hypothetical protein